MANTDENNAVDSIHYDKETFQSISAISAFILKYKAGIDIKFALDSKKHTLTIHFPDGKDMKLNLGDYIVREDNMYKAYSPEEYKAKYINERL